MQKEKVKVQAHEVVADLRAGISDTELMKKYALSARGLLSLYDKLIKVGLVDQAEMDERVQHLETTVDLEEVAFPYEVTRDGILTRYKWKCKTDGWVVCTPTVSEQSVFIGSWDRCLYCIDREMGKIRWKLRTGDVIRSTPRIAEDLVYFGSWDSNFYAVSADTGEEQWRFRTEGPIWLSLIHI
jgi:outer membrane protein assembly factor BamB